MISPFTFAPDDSARAYAAARVRIGAMARSFTSEQAATIVPTCPDWTTRQLMAHLAGVASALVHRNNPTADLQGWIDGHVAARQDSSAADLADEWDEVGERFQALIVSKPRAFAGLLYDVVAHEHDLAHALGTHGERSGDGVLGSLNLAIELLEHDLARHELGSVAVDVDGRRWQAGEGDPQLVLRAPSAFEAMRVLGSRRSERQVRACDWSGPASAAGEFERYVPALDHLGFPADDVIE